MQHELSARIPLTSRSFIPSNSKLVLPQTPRLYPSCIVKQNQLQWKFNVRKKKLQRTSQQNIKMYIRIQSQKSILGKSLNKKKSRYEEDVSKEKSRVSMVGVGGRRVRMFSGQIYDSQEVDREIKKRNKEIIGLLVDSYSYKYVNSDNGNDLMRGYNLDDGQRYIRKKMTIRRIL